MGTEEETFIVNGNTFVFDVFGNPGATGSRCCWGCRDLGCANREGVWRHCYCRCEVVEINKHAVSVFDSIYFVIRCMEIC